MGKRRLALMESSEEEEEPEQVEEQRKNKGKPSASIEKKSSSERPNSRDRKRKSREDDDDYEEEEEKEEEEEEEESEEEEEEEQRVHEDAKPIGEVIKVTGKGKKKRNHYRSFEFDGNVFELEDPVLLTPETRQQKPYAAVIKDITEDTNGNIMVSGQWFYRPEEAERKGGGKWQAKDTRELFYSWHRDEVPAESVMHRCVVHFLPHTKQLPKRSLHPGFVVQKVYDTENRKLFKLTDRDYEDHFQKEIEGLIAKTRERIGEMPEEEPSPPTPTVINPTEFPTDDVAAPGGKRRRVPHIEVPVRNKERLAEKETPGSELRCRAILMKFGALTGDSYRDKWLDKIVQGLLSSKDNAANAEEKALYSEEVVVPAIKALEKAAHETLSDFSKYNQKMRQLDFNLKNTPILAKRFLNKELDSGVILTMSPNELKAGLTMEEKSAKEPEDPKPKLQMTDARCQQCSEKKVGISDIIHAGGLGDRYQLECVACGHSWYAPRDAISSLTIDVPNVTQNVGTAPLATAKFEDIEKKLTSPREDNNSKPLENQKSFKVPKQEDNAAGPA
ncbi:hypothetical protein LUZ60_001010 [Juncus effusus]|nr:hypothetical protein LUZ60_001010 [Juncus effusus]